MQKHPKLGTRNQTHDTRQAALLSKGFRDQARTFYGVEKDTGLSRTMLANATKGGRVFTDFTTLAMLARTLNLSFDELCLSTNQLPPDVTDGIIEHPQLVPVIRTLIRKLEAM